MHVALVATSLACVSAGGEMTWHIDVTAIAINSTTTVTWYHPHGTDKDGSLVAARLAGASGGVSDTRELAINVTRPADASYVDDVAAYVAGLYSSVRSPYLKTDTLVVSSVARPSLYIAEALHAPVLPVQVLARANTWDEALNASSGGRSIVIVGCDYGYDGLWLWLKPSTSLPAAYASLMAAATQLVIVRANDTDTILGLYQQLYIHSSLQACAQDAGAFPRAAALYAAVQKELQPPPAGTEAALLQWEWGLPDATVALLQAAWNASGTRVEPARVVDLEIVDMYSRVPRLWSAYLASNSMQPRGVNLYPYWTGQPALDRSAATVPFPYYTLYTPDWHPIRDAAQAALTALVKENGAMEVATATHAWANGIGSALDPNASVALLRLSGLLPISNITTCNAGVDAGCAWYADGLDCPDAAASIDAWGRPVSQLHVRAAQDLLNASASPYYSSVYGSESMSPLLIDEVCSVMGC